MFFMTQLLSVATAAIYLEQLLDFQHVRFPRIDYIEIQKRLDVETQDYSAYEKHGLGKMFQSIETRLISDVYLAISWLKTHRHTTIFACSKWAGIPLAGYKKRYSHQDALCPCSSFGRLDRNWLLLRLDFFRLWIP
jgi:hypothetical protein